MNKPAPAPCEILEWDSAFFGVRIARITAAPTTPEAMRAVLDWGQRHSIQCLYLLAAADHDEAIRQAEQNGFHLVALRMTYLRQLDKHFPSPTTCAGLVIRPAQAGDLPELREISRTVYSHSRFYVDGHFALERCGALYETWLERSMNNPSGAVWVAHKSHHATGYITCDRTSLTEGQIGLVGVDPAHQGQGIGQALVHAALHWFRQEGITTVKVVTQGRNVGAMKLYQTCGFAPAALEFWYHLWPHSPSSEVRHDTHQDPL